MKPHIFGGNISYFPLFFSLYYFSNIKDISGLFQQKPNFETSRTTNRGVCQLLVHLCTAVIVDLPGGVPRLCGERHPGKSHPDGRPFFQGRGRA